MATGTESSSKALHNFTMPCELRWGNQKHLRCMKVNSDGQILSFRRYDSYSSDQHNRHNSAQHRRTVRDGERGREKDFYSEFLHGSHKVGRDPPPASGGYRRFSDGDDGIAAVREKVMFDLQAAADRMKNAIFKDGFEEGEIYSSPPPPPPSAASPSVEGEIHRPWNLKTRRAACKTPTNKFVSSRNDGAIADGGDNNSAAGGKTLMVDALKPNPGFSEMKASGPAAAADKSIRLTSSGYGAAAIGKKRERPKFSVALSKTDIEEDFIAFLGHRPARRPKKRARIVQRQLDTLFPGLWLKEVTSDVYKVSEAAP